MGTNGAAEVLAELRSSRRVVLTTHVGPDGDGLGCELALARTLRRVLGSEVHIINPTPTQERYAFLDPTGEIRAYVPELEETIASSDTVVVVDINRWDRLGDMAEPVKRSAARKLCIDHHPPQAPFGDAAFIDAEASATGILVHDVVVALAGELPDDVVDPLYVAIMTDTGSFRFANTNTRALEIATELVRRGARPDLLFRHIYETSSPARMRLLGNVLSNLAYECEGRLVHFTITNEILARCGVDREEAEGFTDVVRSVEGSEVVLSFVETAEGGVKVSLRSKADVLDVGQIAESFGGGGHANASGIVDPRPIEEAKRALLAAVRQGLGEGG
jgi:phosphoesterase RecJ-like protein